MLTGGVAPLYWRFLGGLVSVSASSVILSSLLWLKNTVGQMMASISPSKTSCIVSSLLMCPTSSGVLAGLVGDFSADSTYSESPPLPPKLDVDVISLSGSAGGLGDAI